MLRFEPKNRKVRAGPSGRSAYLGTDERAARDYFLSGPHVFSGAIGEEPTRHVSTLVRYNRRSRSRRGRTTTP